MGHFTLPNTIKTNYESSSTSISETDEKRRHFDELLDRLITLIVDKEPTTDETRREILALENSALVRAKKLAKDKQNAINRQNWSASSNALSDVVYSVNEIFSLIDQHFLDEAETFQTLEVDLTQEKFIRSIHNRKLGCQIELKGFDEAHTTYLSSDIHLEQVVYSKTPTPQDRNRFHMTAILNPRVLKPTISEQMKVVWQLDSGEHYSPNQLCEWLIKLLIDQIENSRAIDETNPAGRDIVGGKVRRFNKYSRR